MGVAADEAEVADVLIVIELAGNLLVDLGSVVSLCQHACLIENFTSIGNDMNDLLSGGLLVVAMVVWCELPGSLHKM